MSLEKKIQIIDRALLRDDRGWFLKVLTGKENHLPGHVGEVYMTMAKPGEWRANHYHALTSEWFTVFQGEAKVILEDIHTKERIELSLKANEPKTLFVPSGIAHVFINNSMTDNMQMVVYAENGYDPSDTILFNLL